MAVLLEHSVQTDADNKYRVSPFTFPQSGLHASRRFRVNLAATDYTPHSVRKDTKLSAKPCRSMVKIFVRVGPLSRFVGRPPFELSLSNSVLPLITDANGPNGAISLTQTFNRNLFYFCNGRYFGVHKANNGDQGTIVFTAALRNDFSVAALSRCSTSNVSLTPTYNSARKLASSGASCGVNELHLSG